MPIEKSKLTSKYQATIPKHIRRVLKAKPGEEISWHVVRGMVMVQVPPKIKDPIKVLTSNGISSNLDAVKLVREVREEMI